MRIFTIADWTVSEGAHLVYYRNKPEIVVGEHREGYLPVEPPSGPRVYQVYFGEIGDGPKLIARAKASSSDDDSVILVMLTPTGGHGTNSHTGDLIGLFPCRFQEFCIETNNGGHVQRVRLLS